MSPSLDMSLLLDGAGDNRTQGSSSQQSTKRSGFGADASQSMYISDYSSRSPAQSHYAVRISDEEGARPVLESLTPRDLLRLRLGPLRSYIPLGILCIPFNCRVCTGYHSHIDWEEPKDPGQCLGADQIGIMEPLIGTGLARITVKEHSVHPEWLTVRVYVLPDDHPERPESGGKEREFLSSLRKMVDVSPEAWQSQGNSQSYMPFQSGEDVQPDSMFYVFNHLPSPQPDLSKAPNTYTRAAMEAILDNNELLPGLRTSLYPYQRRSAALMVQREEAPQRRLDCGLIQVIAPDGSISYYEKRSGRLLRKPRYYDTCRGGILAETMGLGKTLICLAVILATKYQWPRVPVEYAGPRVPIRPKVGSLANMAASAVGRHGVPWKQFFDACEQDQGLEYSQCIKLILKNTGSYTIPAPTPPRPLRVPDKGRTVQLSPGTLVICPPNLLQQWRWEISKHTEPGSLKILVMETGNDRLPPVEELTTFDIVLFSRFRFDREEEIGFYRLSSRAPYRSPLRDIHWKRLIVDEGHCMCSFKSTSALISQDLLAERRWVVTGTPTRNLIGIDVELATSQSASASAAVVDTAAIDNALEARTHEPSLREDAWDIQKISSIAKHFLKFEPRDARSDGYPRDPWATALYKSRSGVRGLDPSLEGPLKDLFVRHQPEHVEQDIQLPPLHHRIVRLEPSVFEKLSHNLFNASLISNAVTSERTGPDYMFNSVCNQDLITLVGNLRHSAFFWCGFQGDDVKRTVSISEEYLERKGTRCSPEDRQLLRAAIEYAKQALGSPNWEAFGYYQELGCFVENFPERGRLAWVLQNLERDPYCIGLTMLHAAQKHINSQLYASDPSHRLDMVGAMVLCLARDNLRQSRAGTKRSLVDKKKAFNKFSAEQAGRNQDHWVRDRETPGELAQRALDSADPQQPSSTSKNTKKPKSALKRSRAASSDFKLPPESPLSKTRLIGTASRKLSYLIDQILQYQDQEKILCFYEADFIAYAIAQALDICGVKYLIYANAISNVRKARYLVTFNTTEKFRVMIMNVRHAAFGLNLSTASRVYFVNPVWERELEVQAIKRAHRIGQTKPVYVETLVLANTIEEKMLQRRREMNSAEQDDAREPMYDRTMSDIIKNAEFLQITDEERMGYGQISRLSRPIYVFGQPGRADEDDPDADPVEMDENPKKRVKLSARKSIVIGAPTDQPATASQGPSNARESTLTEATDPINETSPRSSQDSMIVIPDYVNEADYVDEEEEAGEYDDEGVWVEGGVR